jgi:hypothetical protein
MASLIHGRTDRPVDVSTTKEGRSDKFEVQLARTGPSDAVSCSRQPRRMRRAYLDAVAGLFGLLSVLALAGEATTSATARDGQHDFDFNLGTWKIHVERLLHPLTGSKTWVTLEGTKVVQKIWDGRAQLEQVEADGPNARLENMGLMLYDPKSHQWSVSFVNSSDGILEPPPMLGEFKSGRGEFFDSEIYDGRAIVVRITWSGFTPTTHHLEQAFSGDGGRSWESNLKVTLTRAPPGTRQVVPTAAVEAAGQRDFGWQLGSWDVHMKRLEHPLTGSTTWTELDGKLIVRPIWNGRANLAEISSDSPSGRLEFLSLRLFNPKTRQWSLNFASSDSGVLSTPLVGEFSNGQCEFYHYESVNGRMTLVRLTFGDITSGASRDERAFSVDGGQTWETNWINTATRIGAPDLASRGIAGASDGYTGCREPK